jgi:hypothetical protein
MFHSYLELLIYIQIVCTVLIGYTYNDAERKSIAYVIYWAFNAEKESVILVIYRVFQKSKQMFKLIISIELLEST